ncbi:ferric reductase family protein [Aromatoleum buckelii]|uniref:FAD-binding FR-type domain-containing protein n=1 Tax=Aromatoleum buckelii TaxID=200254 RepID=A0ABX1MYW2_9RHOO|nr:NADPH oxidase family protein [Aromatoleum buckelii]MCK0510593.1 ferric reductase family protein [Aromatoleum buckelii]
MNTRNILAVSTAAPGGWRPGRLTARHNLWSGIPWLLLFSAALVAQFYLGFIYQSNETTNLPMRLARGTAWSLLVVLAVLWLPVMRHAVSALRRSRLGEGLPLDKAKSVHRWLGHLFIALALVHGANYLGYFTTLNAPFTDILFGREPDLLRAMRTTMYEFVSDDEYIDITERWIAAGMPKDMYEAELGYFIKDECGKCHSSSSTQTYAIPGMPITNYAEAASWTGENIQSRQFRINMSGLVLFVLGAALWIFSLKHFRRRHHHLFQRIHRLGYLFAALLLLHIPSLEWIYLPLVGLAAELYLSRRHHLYRDCIARLTPLEGNVVRLEIDRPQGMILRAGHYVRLRIPALSRKEWHEFSLTGQRPTAEGDSVVLKIRCSGDWTGRLQATLAGKTEHTLQVDLRGPYASPVAHALKTGEWVLVAGGIGVTPFLGLIREILREPGMHREFHLVWMVREPALLEWVRPLVERLCERRDIRCHWYFYLTDLPEDGRPPVWLERVQGEPGVRLRSGMPDWSTLAAEIAVQSRRPTCFVCGPAALASDVVRVCRRRGWPVRLEQF